MRSPVRCAVTMAAFLALACAGPAAAYNYVPSSNGETWGVQDGAAPRVDTGSIRDTTSNSLRGFGGIRVRTSTPALRNGELVRGFNLAFNPPERFTSENAVDMGGVAIWRSIRFNRTQNWGRWLDAFHNTTDAPITVDVAFGGQTGIGNASGTTNSRVTETSSGDAAVTAADTWALTRTGATTDPAAQGPSAVVIGSASPFGGALSRVANFLREDPFTTAAAASGHESNFVGYQHTFVLQPGETRTLARFVVIGTAETTGTNGQQVTAVRTTASSLAANPSLADLSRGELCTLGNWNLTSASVAAFDPADCTEDDQPQMPPLADANPTTTGAKYDVVGKTINQLQDDMEDGTTTSAEITRAYLDRIAAYDVGPWGFNSYTTVASDALDQAGRADAERKAGRTGALLGIPIAVKDLLDTKDMPTTNGSLVFEDFQPEHDAKQVELLRDAGAVIIGKASLEEYAQSGHYSDSAYGQVWNAFSPSKSSIASSGGPATATAASFAAGSLGSQTGDSLYGPASGASLYTLRGTDGVTSLTGAMPLTWLQDYVGGITRSLEDLADIMDATAKTDPADPLSADTDPSNRFTESWRDALDPDALEGKRIAYYDTAFVDPFGTTDTVNAQKAALQKFEDAGATLVKIDPPPTFPSAPSGDRNFTGWKLWIDAHPESPYTDAREIVGSQKRLPYRRSANGYTGAGAMSEAQQQAYIDWRLTTAKDAITSWMDNPINPVDPDSGTPSPGAIDAVAFPGLRSVISLNDGGSNAFGRGDPPTNGLGGPSVAFPAGVNGFGEPVNLQLSGRPYADQDLLGYAYAFDRVADAHLEPDTVPALAYEADPTPPVIEQPTPAAPEPAPVPAPPAPSAPATAAPSQAKLTARAAWTVPKLATLRGKGLAVRITTSEPAVLRAELRLSSATARRLGIPAVIGRASRGFLRAGTATLQVRLTGRAARALRRSTSASVRLTTSATTVDGRKTTQTRTLTVR